MKHTHYIQGLKLGQFELHNNAELYLSNDAFLLKSHQNDKMIHYFNRFYHSQRALNLSTLQVISTHILEPYIISTANNCYCELLRDISAYFISNFKEYHETLLFKYYIHSKIYTVLCELEKLDEYTDYDNFYTNFLSLSYKFPMLVDNNVDGYNMFDNGVIDYFKRRLEVYERLIEEEFNA